MFNSLIKLIFCVALLLSCTNNETENNGYPEPSIISIQGISPTSGPKNTIVTISGKNFGTDPKMVEVFFNGLQAEIQYVEDDTIVAVVPEGAFSGIITISIDGRNIVGPEFIYIITDELQGTVFAGGTRGYLDGVGTYAQFNMPVGVTLDNEGNLYIADFGNNRIRKITPVGLVSTLAGSSFGYRDGQGVNAEFKGPYGVAVDMDGNFFVTDRHNNRIRKISPDGEVSTLAGSSKGYADGEGEDAQFNEPYGVAIDPFGNLYVADSGNNRIRMITPSGAVSTLAGSSPGYADGQGEDAQFNGPYDVTLDNAGNVYIADFVNNRIRKLTPDGVVSTMAGSSRGFANGKGVEARFDGPHGIALDMDENLYVADFVNKRIRKISPDGEVSTLKGSSPGFEGGQGENVQFSGPTGVALDEDYNVYVVDIASHAILKIPQD